jgi:hypothetical protein
MLRTPIQRCPARFAPCIQLPSHAKESVLHLATIDSVPNLQMQRQVEGMHDLTDGIVSLHLPTAIPMPSIEVTELDLHLTLQAIPVCHRCCCS